MISIPNESYLQIQNSIWLKTRFQSSVEQLLMETSLHELFYRTVADILLHPFSRYSLNLFLLILESYLLCCIFPSSFYTISISYLKSVSLFPTFGLSFSPWKSLTSLCVIGQSVGKNSLSQILSQAQQLEDLSLLTCNLNRKGISSINELKYLKALNLTGTNIDDEKLKLLTTNSNLQSLKLRRYEKFSVNHVYFKTSSIVYLTDDGMHHIAKLFPSLTELDLSSQSQLTDNSLNALSENCNQLQVIVLHACTGLQES